MGNTIADLFKEETKFDVKASEMYGIMREATKAEFLLNAVKCDVPHTYARQIATGEKEDAPLFVGIDLSSAKDGVPGQQDNLQETTVENATRATGQDVRSGSVGIVRKHEQRVEWIDIKHIVSNGHAGVSLPPGTEINFTLKNGLPASVVVVGVDHYEKGDCVFWFRKVVGNHCMNENNTNEGGFRDSAMRKYLNKDIFNLLPDDLQSVIAIHNTVQKIGGETVESQGDKLFLPSLYEEIGYGDLAEHNGTDKQFPYFRDCINRIAHNNTGEIWYWTADPRIGDPGDFCYIYKGYCDIENASTKGGIAPLFVIK